MLFTPATPKLLDLPTPKISNLPYSFFLPIMATIFVVPISRPTAHFFFPLSIYLVQTTCFVNLRSIFLYLYNELSKTAFLGLIIFKLLLHICDISKINLIIIVPIEHFNLPLGIIDRNNVFQNHRHKSHATTRHIFFINLPETSGTLAVKLLDNGIIPPHNQRKRTRSI
jgi:hypothetical protein